MKMRLCLSLAAALIALVPLFSGCGDSGSAGPANKTLTIGFAQTGAESAWRNANTISIKDEAKKRGVDLRFVDANSKVDNQRKAISDFIAQKVDVIMVAPLEVDGWDQVLKDAKAAGIPVIISDRRISSPPDLYTCFIGSDFLEEGRRAGEWLAKKTAGKANIAELQGEVGSAPARDRKKGFEEAIAKFPGMKIIMSQTANFRRADGQQLMATFLQKPEAKDITAVFAHNDDMALGAIGAIEAAGKKPGKDMIIISIDGIKEAFQAMADGKLNCTVECNPLLGPSLFDAAEKIHKGEKVEKEIYSKEGVFDDTQVTKELIDSRKY